MLDENKNMNRYMLSIAVLFVVYIWTMI